MPGESSTEAANAETADTVSEGLGWQVPQGRGVLYLSGALSGGYNILNDDDMHDISH